MPSELTKENNLSKDELLEILNEIDAEHHQGNPKDTHGNRTESATRHSYPNPGNPFY